MLGVIRHDMQRALAYARGRRPSWRDEKFIIKPSLDEALGILRAMRAKRGRISLDIETDGKAPHYSAVRCIGIFDGEVGLCIPLLRRDGSYREFIPHGKKKAKRTANWVNYWSSAAKVKVLEALSALCAEAGERMVALADGPVLPALEGWNLQFDRLTLRLREGIYLPAYFDGILAHHVVAPYMPHSLAFCASIYPTDVCYYKSTDDGEAWSTVNDDELYLYCLRDCKSTYIVNTSLRAEVNERAHGVDARINLFDHRMALECERWREVGVLVDQVALGRFRLHYGDVARRALKAMQGVAEKLRVGSIVGELEALAKGDFPAVGAVEVEDMGDEREGGDDLFSPGSLPQLRELLGTLGVPLLGTTETGQISTAKDFLLEARRLLIEHHKAGPKDPRLAFLDYLFAWRQAGKIESTYLWPELGPGGRIHPTFNPFVVPTGRLASKDPGFQQQPKPIRGMYVAPDGYSLVAGDWDSVELRGSGYVSGEPNLIDAFDAYDAGTGPKLHKLNCSRIFSIPIEEVDPDSAIYRAAKAVIFLVAYGGGPQTGYETARKEMPDLTFDGFLVCYNALKVAYPTWFKAQQQQLIDATSRGYIDSPIMQRRMFFFEPIFGDDTPEAAKMLNAPIQSLAADIVGNANFRVLDRVVLPMRKKLRRGEVIEQLAQIHDELLFEVPDRIAEEFARRFKKVAEEPVDAAHRHWRFPVDVKVKKRWGVLPWEKERKTA